MTTLTVPVITQSRAVTHHSNTVRSRTKRTATTGLGDLVTFTAKTDFKENYARTLETESPYEMSDVTDVSSTALMVTRTPHAPQNFAQNRVNTTETNSDVTEQTHNSLTSQTELTASTTDDERSVSADVGTETQTALDFHTATSEAKSTDVDPTLTESSTSSFPVSNTDGVWTNATTKSIRDVQTVLPFKTRTTRAITDLLPNTDTRATPNTATSSAKTRASATTSPTAPDTSTAAPDADAFTSATYTTTATTPAATAETTAETTAATTAETTAATTAATTAETTAETTPATTAATTAETTAETTTSMVSSTAALSTGTSAPPPSTAAPTTASTTKLATTEAVRCLVNITAASIHVDYCVFNFTTPGKSCSFIMTNGSNFTRCSQDMKHPDHYACLIAGLTPGATYWFGIVSEMDGAHLNVTAQTGKCSYVPS
ncbi:hypothetical protein M9458_054129 [Cirrhinus mrigala]|uniref:Uncharacterized protein n=1 Tax=Cirrhinus mrigala TaxID=683832 RepID=A0ABD0MNN3_CIRMR